MHIVSRENGGQLLFRLGLFKMHPTSYPDEGAIGAKKGEGEGAVRDPGPFQQDCESRQI